MKVKAKLKDGRTVVKMLIRHPMETGRRKDPETGEPVPRHHIQQVTATYKDKVVFSAQFGTAVSKDPFMAFHLKNAIAGEEITLTWVDNTGASDTTTVAIQ